MSARPDDTDHKRGLSTLTYGEPQHLQRLMAVNTDFPTERIISIYIINSNIHCPLFSASKYAEKEVRVAKVKAGARVSFSQSCAVSEHVNKQKLSREWIKSGKRGESV